MAAGGVDEIKQGYELIVLSFNTYATYWLVLKQLAKHLAAIRLQFTPEGGFGVFGVSLRDPWQIDNGIFYEFEWLISPLQFVGYALSIEAPF